jgi:phenylacetate-coenzyme A ligase PaaK-like adenylate-forming protein
MVSLFDPLQGLAELAMAWDLQCVPYSPPHGWQFRREQRLQALLAHARNRSAMFRRAPPVGEQASVSLSAWPVTHKADLMRRFADWVTDPTVTLPALRAFISDPQRIGEAFGSGMAVWESSGSSGEPGLFVHDARALQVYDLLEALRRPWRWLGAGPLAFVGATHGHFASVCTIERLRRQHPWLAPHMRSLSFLRPLPELVTELEQFAPRVLAAYPSTALALAEEAAAGRLRLSLQSVWLGGETLTPAVRAAVQRAFGAPVINSYGASECLTLAGECDHGALHLNADWVILEPVDEHHRPVEPGTFGATTLLTNLANRVQPLIRYDIGDRVRLLPQACACGSSLPVIEVEGRKDDCLILRTSQGRPVRLPPLALVSVLEEAGVFDFQLRQQGESALSLALVHGGARGKRELERARRALNAYLRTQGLGGASIDGHCGEPCRHGHSGKTARIVGARAGA